MFGFNPQRVNGAVKQVAEEIRGKYPGALLGFLGNSLSVLAVADAYHTPAKQHIVPFSHPHPLINIGYTGIHDGKRMFSIPNAYDRRKNDTANNFASLFADTPISPKKVIESNTQLVIIDRVQDGKGIALFGMLWNNLALEQGYSSTKAAAHFELCVIHKREKEQSDWQDIGVLDPRKKRLVYEARLETFNSVKPELSFEVMDIDDQSDKRLSPHMDIVVSASPDICDTRTAQHNILEYYLHYASQMGLCETSRDEAVQRTRDLLICPT